MGKAEGKNHLGETGVDGRLMLRWIFRKWDVGVWTALSYCMDSWRALENAVTNLRVPYNAGNFLTSC